MDEFWYIIANPVSGNGALEKRWPQIERILQELGIDYTVQFTERRGHATRLAQDAILKGRRHILGIGGDGTNHEIVNGIFSQQHAPATDISYALLPVGTGNDWARTYGIPHDPRQRLERLKAGKTVLQDIGIVKFMRDGIQQQRFFVNVAGMAYDAFIAREMDAARGRITSRLQYLALVARHLFRYELTEARILFDGRTAQDFFYTVNIGLCRYSGGGMQFVPQAIPDDGLFALTFARQLPKWKVLALTPRFYDGSILSHPQVEGFQAREIRVEHPGSIPTLVEADGEFLGETPVSFSLLEKALKVMV